MRQSRTLLPPTVARGRNVARRAAISLAVAMLVVGVSGVAQEASPPPVCQSTTSFDAAPDLASFSAHSWHFSVSCTGPVIRFYSASVGVSIKGPGGYRDSFTGNVGFDSHTTDVPAPQSVSGTTDVQAIRMRCLAPGSYTFTSGALVDYVGFLPYDSATSCHGNCPLLVGAPGTPGGFEINAEDSVVTFRVELAQPPVGANNVRVVYKFGANSGEPTWQVDNGSLNRIGSFAGELLMKLPSGHHTFTAFACGGPRATAEIEVPAAEDPGVFTFDLPSTENVKVLTHRYGDHTYPAPLHDTYPSPLQTEAHQIKVQGTLADTSGRPLVGKTVYFRIIDPPDPSSYVPASDRIVGDNADAAAGTLNSGGRTVSTVSGASGRIAIVLHTTDHVSGDNYKVEASATADFSCGRGGCPKSATYTAWKRIYYEEAYTFRRGSAVSLTRRSVTGEADVWVEDLSPFRSGQTVRLIHAPQLVRGARPQSGVPGFSQLDPLEFFYEEDHVVDVVGPSTDAQGNPQPAHLRLRANDTLQHTYVADPSLAQQRGATQKHLADFVGIVGAGNDFLRADPSLVAGLYADAFTEYVPTPTPVPELPYCVPLYSTLEELATKWFFNAVRTGSGSQQQALPNHQHLLGAAGTEARRAPLPDGTLGYGVRFGSAGVMNGTNFSFVWTGQIELSVTDPATLLHGLPADRIVSETTAHELTHQWRTNASKPGEHCTEDGYQNDGRWCMMHTPAAPPDTAHHGNELADGFVSLHYVVAPNGAVDSEYVTIRKADEPLPPQ